MLLEVRYSLCDERQTQESNMLLGKTSVDGVPISQLTKGSEKKVRYKCDDCGDVHVVMWSHYLRTTKRRRMKKTYCRECASRRNGVKRRGTPAWNKGKRLPSSQRGSNHPSWKGGAFIDAHGYRRVHRPTRKTVKSKWEYYVKEHMVVMEHMLGRRLTKNEVVHHVDGQKLNNRRSNLYLTHKHSGHRNLHQSLQELGYQLVRAGLIKLNRRKGIYVAHGKLRELLEHPKSPLGHNVDRKVRRDGVKTKRDK